MQTDLKQFPINLAKSPIQGKEKKQQGEETALCNGVDNLIAAIRRRSL